MNISFNVDQFGCLHLIDENGAHHENVKVVRAFPISEPLQGISILNQDGHELVWLDHLDQLSSCTQEILKNELAQMEFIPEIEKITGLNSFALPSVWEINTDRGKTKLKLNSEQDLRRVGTDSLIITDANGIQYFIRHQKNLDKFSKKVLDRFL